MDSSSASALIGLSWSAHARKVGNCQIHFRWQGKPVAVSVKTKNVAMAEKMAKGAILAWLRRKGQSLPAPMVAQLTIELELPRYIRREYAHAKEGTIDGVQRSIKLLADNVGVITLPEITREAFGRFVDLVRPRYDAKSWSNILGDVRKFLRWEMLERNLTEDPTAGVKKPPLAARNKRKMVWPDSEVAAVSKALREPYREILTVIRWSGLDECDIHGLEKGHMVEVAPGAWKIRKRREKGRSDREMIDLPISSRILPALLKRWEAAPSMDSRLYPFPTFRHAHSWATWFATAVRRARAKLGLPPNTIKALRHTFATYHVERGVPMDELRRWMGHVPGSKMLEEVYNLRISSHRFMD